jgi:hypothetical protein
MGRVKWSGLALHSIPFVLSLSKQKRLNQLRRW